MAYVGPNDKRGQRVRVGVPANFKGKKGRSGRKPLWQELELVDIVKGAFKDGVDVEELEARLKTKKFPLILLVIYKAIKSEAILMNLLQKLLPDKFDFNGNVKHDFSAKAKERLGKYKK